MIVARQLPKLTSSRPRHKGRVNNQEVGTNAERQHDDQATSSHRGGGS
jgi:hypothetical protein